MARIVVDASITLAWCLPEEQTEEAASVCRVVREAGAVVPGLWPLEVANALVHMVRRGVVSAAFLRETLVDLAKLPIETDPESHERAWGEVSELALAQGLTVYDAAYLELAQRRRLPLATLDRELARAARTIGVALLPEPAETPSPPPRPRRRKRP